MQQHLEQLRTNYTVSVPHYCEGKDLLDYLLQTKAADYIQAEWTGIEMIITLSRTCPKGSV